MSHIPSPLLSGGVATAVPATGAAGDHPFNMSHLPSPLLLGGGRGLVSTAVPAIGAAGDSSNHPLMKSSML